MKGSEIKFLLQEGNHMVTRTQANLLEEFKGKVEDVILEKNTFSDVEADQYHIIMAPIDVKVAGKTERLHEWVRLSPKTTQMSIPEGSIVDRYLQQVEACLPEAKKAKTINEALELMKGHTFQFKRVKLGRSFEGKPAREMWICVSLIE
jgi:hypothetical protein